jgi:hypothetical protein
VFNRFAFIIETAAPRVFVRRFTILPIILCAFAAAF